MLLWGLLWRWVLRRYSTLTTCGRYENKEDCTSCGVYLFFWHCVMLSCMKSLYIKIDLWLNIYGMSIGLFLDWSNIFSHELNNWRNKIVQAFHMCLKNKIADSFSGQRESFIDYVAISLQFWSSSVIRVGACALQTTKCTVALSLRMPNFNLWRQPDNSWLPAATYSILIAPLIQFSRSI